MASLSLVTQEATEKLAICSRFTHEYTALRPCRLRGTGSLPAPPKERPAVPSVRLLLVGLICVLPGLLTGCGPAEFETVTGAVTFDGQPLPQGDILFQPTDPQFGPDAGKIIDGKFSLRVRPGSTKVVIGATRLVPGKKGPMRGEPVYEDYIPAKYNAQTTLTADVKSGSKNEFTFTLTSD
jgi:hypothetical protein